MTAAVPDEAAEPTPKEDAKATTTMKPTEEEKKPVEKTTAALEKPTSAAPQKQPETSHKAQQQGHNSIHFFKSSRKYT